MPAYDSTRFSPPAPLALVGLRDPESGAVQSDVPMLLDTGADVSLLPQPAVAALGVTIATGRQYELVGFDGSMSRAPIVRVELILLGRTFRGQFLLIEQNWGILGRNVLNALPLLLDGPRLTWEITSP
jgi:Aspartyl protease